MKNLTEKFTGLTHDLREQFLSVKSEPELNTFLEDSGIALTQEERAVALEYMNSGKIEMSDDEMDTVTGGKGESGLNDEEKRYEEAAKIDGRIHKMPKGTCSCSNLVTVYAKDHNITKQYVGRQIILHDVYLNKFCYKCMRIIK